MRFLTTDTPDAPPRLAERLAKIAPQLDWQATEGGAPHFADPDSMQHYLYAQHVAEAWTSQGLLRVQYHNGYEDWRAGILTNTRENRSQYNERMAHVRAGGTPPAVVHPYELSTNSIQMSDPESALHLYVGAHTRIGARLQKDWRRAHDGYTWRRTLLFLAGICMSLSPLLLRWYGYPLPDMVSGAAVTIGVLLNTWGWVHVKIEQARRQRQWVALGLRELADLPAPDRSSSVVGESARGQLSLLSPESTCIFVEPPPEPPSPPPRTTAPKQVTLAYEWESTHDAKTRELACQRIIDAALDNMHRARKPVPATPIPLPDAQMRLPFVYDGLDADHDAPSCTEGDRQEAPAAQDKDPYPFGG